MIKSKSLSDFTALKKKYLYKFFQKKDLKKLKVDGFHCFVIPEQYYIWKGIKIDDPNNKWFVDGIKDHDGVFSGLSSNFFADKDVASHYGTKKGGVDLQFKIVKDVVLIDLSDYHNIHMIWKFFSNMKLYDVDKYPYVRDLYLKSRDDWMSRDRLQKKYPTEELWWDHFITENFKDIIVETIGNFEYDTKSKKVKSPTKVHRRSAEWFDNDLVKMICNVFGDNCNGWIYFRGDVNDEFHDEILLCNARDNLIYIDYHKK